jgi:hypothetical protein
MDWDDLSISTTTPAQAGANPDTRQGGANVSNPRGAPKAAS